MRKRIAGVATALAIALGLVGIVGFRCGGHCSGHGRDPAQVAAMVNERVDDALDDVKATPDQRTRIHAVVDRLLADGRALHEGNAGTHEELLAQWRSDQPDRARLHALVGERAEKHRAFADEVVDAAVEVHGILTAEQRAELAKRMERHAWR